MHHPDAIPAQALAQLRQRLGYSQTALAAAMGVPKSALNKVERGRRALQISELVSIAQVCGLTDEQAMALARALVASEDGDALARDAA